MRGWFLTLILALALVGCGDSWIDDDDAVDDDDAAGDDDDVTADDDDVTTDDDDATPADDDDVTPADDDDTTGDDDDVTADDDDATADDDDATPDDDDDATPDCPYPAGAVEPMTLNEVLTPYSWPSAIAPDGSDIPMDLVSAPCANDPDIDWSPFDVLLFVSFPAW